MDLVIADGTTGYPLPAVDHPSAQDTGPVAGEATPGAPQLSLRRLRGTQRSGGNSVRRIVTFGLCVLALPMLAAAQTKDDFAYWDANNNGDLTCSEAEDGPDGGLRLPAYQDDRDGTGIIYEWLERSRSSDTDNDGVACDSASNPSGYIPNVQPVDDPSQGCPVDAEPWRAGCRCARSSHGRVTTATPSGPRTRASRTTSSTCCRPPCGPAGRSTRRTPAWRSTSGRMGLRRRTSSTSSRSPKRTTAASRTTGDGTSRPTWTTSRSRTRR